MTHQNFYFPLHKGRYEVIPGLHLLGTDFGNGHDDSLIFQFDTNFTRYHQEKIAARKERLAKYYCAVPIPQATQAHIARFIIQQLCQEHPDLFLYQRQQHHHLLSCKLTGDSLIFDSHFNLVSPLTNNNGYRDSLDALVMQLQEDIALVEISNRGTDRITALHLCFPNHWAAEEKIGQSFLLSHAPVPGMEKINRQIKPLLTSLLTKGPFVRFAWGLATDERLNHHPIAPKNADPSQWQGRQFDPARPELYLRVERQVLKGFPAINTLLFTIRTYFYDLAILKESATMRQPLLSALQTMSPETLDYKGLTQSLPLISAWLEN